LHPGAQQKQVLLTTAAAAVDHLGHRQRRAPLPPMGEPTRDDE
jgi:hypothetical protein